MDDDGSGQQWAQSPHWAVGPWYLRPNEHGDYVAYQSSRRDNPLWWALNGAVILGRNGHELDLPPGVSLDDIEAYTRMAKSLVGQEVVISTRQAEEFAQILGSVSKRHLTWPTAIHTWAAEATLRILPG
jgi:hypothetical protein